MMTDAVRTLLARWRSTLNRLTRRGRESGPSWSRSALAVPAGAFGPGSRHHFGHYLEGESRVSFTTIDEIVEWLQACEYVTDHDLFNDCDFWQHPASFEERRRGDCEDFALWAWRKLAEAGIEAEFVVGRLIRRDGQTVDRQHAWIVYRVDGAEFLFEPAERSRHRMIRELVVVMDDYVPHFAVDHRLQTFVFTQE